MSKPESICVFGDSVSWGAWDIEKGGWVNRLWLYVGKRDNDYVEIHNLSISGGTTTDILNRFENEARVRKADAIIFQTGGNDASSRKTLGGNIVPIEKFKANIEEIIARAKLITGRIIFCDLRNCDETKTMPVWWDEDLSFQNNELERYTLAMREICERNSILYIDLPHLENSEFDEQDGLHPNASGHDKIFNRVKNFLEEKKYI